MSSLNEPWMDYLVPTGDRLRKVTEEALRRARKHERENPSDDPHTIALHVLAKCLKTFKPGRGVKFDTYFSRALEFGFRTDRKKVSGAVYLEEIISTGSREDQRGEGSYQELISSDEDITHHVDMSHMVREMLDTLPERNREAIELHYFDGLTQEEAGLQMDPQITQSQVSRLIIKGIRMLRENYGSSEQEEMYC